MDKDDLTSSPTQYFPEVSFRIGSRAVVKEKARVNPTTNTLHGQTFKKKLRLILHTLKTTINEVLSPWNLLFSYFLEHGQILKHSHHLLQSL